MQTKFVLFVLGVWLLLVQIMPDKLADIRVLPIMAGLLVAMYAGMRLFGVGGEVKPAKKQSKKSRSNKFLGLSRSKKQHSEIPADPDMRKVWTKRVETSTKNPDLWMKPRPTAPVQLDLDLFGNAVPVQNGNLQYHAPARSNNNEPDWSQLPPPPGVSQSDWGR